MAVWKNYLRRRRTRARRHRPWAPWELLQIVRERAAAGERIRAVGSGHSASAAPQPSEGGHFVELDHIAGEMPWPWYADGGQYVRVGAGTTIAALNAMLDARGLALHNMGSWDGQTVAGATATGTHGSGLRHPPMCDRVVAIELVTDEKDPDSGARVQRFLRIEREGLTDVGAFEAARARFGDEDDPVRTLKLEPDDDLLNAARIHLGCFGVVYALTLEVRPRFWLKERPQVMTWDRVKEVPLEERARAHPEFFWMLCVPHRYAEGSPYAGQPLCVLIEREELRPRDGAAPRRDGVLDRLLRFGVQVVSTGLLENVGLFFPRLGQWVFRRDFEGRSVFSSASAEVMKTSLGPEVHAISIEAFVPLARAQEAVGANHRARGGARDPERAARRRRALAHLADRRALRRGLGGLARALLRRAGLRDRDPAPLRRDRAPVGASTSRPLSIQHVEAAGAGPPPAGRAPSLGAAPHDRRSGGGRALRSAMDPLEAGLRALQRVRHLLEPAHRAARARSGQSALGGGRAGSGVGSGVKGSKFRAPGGLGRNPPGEV